MESLAQFAPNAGIVVACLLIGLILKWFFGGNQKLLSGIPWMLAAAGALLSLIVVGVADTDVVSSIAQGIVSGLAACGAYQVAHQQTKLKRDDYDEDEWEAEMNDAYQRGAEDTLNGMKTEISSEELLKAFSQLTSIVNEAAENPSAKDGQTGNRNIES